ncbi:ABC transporter substrate-binding protein [Neobacillus sp. 114]|uniref:ABC transporter substrate-binding protein n=1 Tax=Neobacillus sp. 114 TaxID=3048535 RepID=UPI001C24729B|nr:ABC transporter substrate-binding protein [Neobacillus sp. 114]MBU8918847.1 ABC transporter substrate-binding protein [Bacillus sp. FJAT-29953]
MRKMKSLITLTILILLLSSLAACVRPESQSSSSKSTDGKSTKVNSNEKIEGPIKVGVVIPLSGPSSQIGEQVKKGYELALEKINASGGVKALNGAKLEFVYADHTGKPDVGAREAQRLVNDEKVVMLTGSYESGVTMAVAQAAERMGVPYLVPYSAGNIITESGFKNTFRTRPPSKVWVETQYEFLKYLNDNFSKNITKVASLWEDGAWGQGTGTDIKEIGKKYGLDIVADVSFRSGSQDLSTQLTKIKSSGANAILAASYLNDTMKAQQTMASLNFQRPYLSIGTTEVHDDFFQLGKLAEGQVGSTAWLPDISEIAKKVGEEFQAKFGNAMNDDAAYAYSASYIIHEALEKSASIDSKQLRDTFATTEFTSPDANIIPTKEGKIKFNEKGQADALIMIGQAQEGKWVTIWPEKYASKKFVDSQWFK